MVEQIDSNLLYFLHLVGYNDVRDFRLCCLAIVYFDITALLLDPNCHNVDKIKANSVLHKFIK
jgi:hypothetical protein